ncbi:MAG: hypothetical protein AAF805_08465 [Planctomycetota bacterium]
MTSHWQAVRAHLQNNDVAAAARYLESEFSVTPDDRFVFVAHHQFINSPTEVLAYINAFVEACSEKFDLKAVYLEMNGFAINPDRWYFEPFGYGTYDDDPDELDWLCDWLSPQWPSKTLVGLGKTQSDFRWYSAERVWKTRTHERVHGLAELLVMVRFVQLVQSSLKCGRLAKPVPVLATAHDFDILGRFLP